MSMPQTLDTDRWNDHESTGKPHQNELGLLGLTGTYHMVPIEVVRAAGFAGCLNEACRHGGKKDQDYASDMGISVGYMSKYLRELAARHAELLVEFLFSSRSLAPLQWIADRVGCDLVIRNGR